MSLISNVLDTKFYGEPDEFTQRNGVGIEGFCYEKFQKYNGEFTNDNLHGNGSYTYFSQDEQYLYEGKFYTNLLHAYCSVYYGDGELFEGLFKEHCRYGPGIYTYKDNSQDVGIWLGHSLYRLSTAIRVSWLPTLAHTPSAKSYLLKYRKIIPITKNSMNDYSERVIKLLNLPPELCQDNPDLLCNKFVSNPRSKAFFKRLHEENFFGNDDNTIDVFVPKASTTSSKSFITAPSIDSFVLVNDNIVEQEEYLQSVEKLLTPLEKLKEYLKGKSNCTCHDIKENENKCLISIYELENALKKERDEILNKLKFIDDEGFHESMMVCEKVLVESLLAWNNNERLMDITQFCFKCRRMENNLSFKVEDVIEGLRNRFNQPGRHELACYKFLDECSDGKHTIVETLLKMDKINPDLNDLRGNTGLFYAAARDRTKIIAVLILNGASINFMNDEGLTALTMCMCRYVAHKYDVMDWESAFIPEDISIALKNDVFLWRSQFIQGGHRSSSVLLDKSASETLSALFDLYPDLYKEAQLADKEVDRVLEEMQEKVKNIQDEIDIRHFQHRYIAKSNSNQKYLFDLTMKKPPRPKVIKEKKTKPKKSKKQKKDNKSPRSKKNDKNDKKKKKKEKEIEDEIIKKEDVDQNIGVKFVQEETQPVSERSKKDQQLDVIFDTIKCLLNQGANPNEGLIPIPALHIAVFSKKIKLIKELLNHYANPNIKSIDENLTALHVITCMEPFKKILEITQELIKNNADVNLRTNMMHWKDENASLLGNSPSSSPEFNIEEEQGKTPLHALAMRFDFFIEEKKTYLLELAKMLLENKADPNSYYLGHSPLTIAMLRGNKELVEMLLLNKADPNLSLKNNMGVPLTLLILKRFKNVVQPTELSLEMQELLFKFNANPLNEIQMQIQNDEFIGNTIEFANNEYYVPPKKEKIGKGKKGKNAAKKPKTKTSTKKSASKKSKKKEDHEILRENLLTHAKNCLIKFIKSKVLRYLFEFGMEGEMDDDISESLATFLMLNDVKEITQLLCDSGEFKYDEDIHGVYLEILELVQYINGGDLTNMEEFEILYENRPKPSFLLPELDKDGNKYQVCFQCCTKKDKELLLCPSCCLVYFCSQECNVADSKNKFSKHPCHFVFYKNEKQLKDNLLADEQPYLPCVELREKINQVKELRKNREETLFKELEKLKELLKTLGMESAIPKGIKKPKDLLEKLLKEVKKVVNKAGTKSQTQKGMNLVEGISRVTILGRGKSRYSKTTEDYIEKLRNKQERTFDVKRMNINERYKNNSQTARASKEKKRGGMGDGKFNEEEGKNATNRKGKTHSGGGDYSSGRREGLKKDSSNNARREEEEEERGGRDKKAKSHKTKNFDQKKSKKASNKLSSSSSEIHHEKVRRKNASGQKSHSTKSGNNKRNKNYSSDSSMTDQSGKKEKTSKKNKNKADGKIAKGYSTDSSTGKKGKTSKKKFGGGGKNESYSSSELKHKAGKSGKGKSHKDKIDKMKRRHGGAKSYSSSDTSKTHKSDKRKTKKTQSKVAKIKHEISKSTKTEKSYKFGKPFKDKENKSNKSKSEKLDSLKNKTQKDKDDSTNKHKLDDKDKSSSKYKYKSDDKYTSDDEDKYKDKEALDNQVINKKGGGKLYEKYGDMIGSNPEIIKQLNNLLNLKNLPVCLQKLYAAFCIFFPDVEEISDIICPFVCFNEGQLYYQFKQTRQEAERGSSRDPKRGKGGGEEGGKKYLCLNYGHV